MAVFQPHRVERDHFSIVRHQMRDVLDQFLGIEGGDEGIGIPEAGGWDCAPILTASNNKITTKILMAVGFR